MRSMNASPLLLLDYLPPFLRMQEPKVDTEIEILTPHSS